MKRATLWGAELVTATICGTEVKATRRTHAHLRSTVARLAAQHPNARLVILQPCYNTGVPESAGTHDKDAVLDVRIAGMNWWDAQRFLRSCGWAAWYRHTGTWAKAAAWHIHMASIPTGLPKSPTTADVSVAYAEIGLHIGIFVPGQVDDYYAHALGLKGQHRSGSDTSWFPTDINATVFQEDDMGYLDWPKADRDALVADIVNGVFSRPLGALGVKFGPAIQAIYKAVVKGK